MEGNGEDGTTDVDLPEVEVDVDVDTDTDHLETNSSPPASTPSLSDTSDEHSERRSTPRVVGQLGVFFKSTDELAQAVQAFTKNIGLGGLCLLTRKTYQVGACLELTIQLGDGQSLNTRAVVAWTRPGTAIGVRFDLLDGEQRARIESVIGRLQGQIPEKSQKDAGKAG